MSRVQIVFVILCDGSRSSSSRNGRFGAVIFKGKIMESCIAGLLCNCSAVLEAEIRGITAGLMLAERMSPDAMKIRILSDSVEAIWALQRGFDTHIDTT